MAQKLRVDEKAVWGILVALLLTIFPQPKVLSAQRDLDGASNRSTQLRSTFGQLEHVETTDIGLIDSAFSDGYTDNIVDVKATGRRLQTLTVQSVTNNIFIGERRTSYGVWTRDLYWGFLGWAQAGNDSVLATMKSSIRLLILAKNKNQAHGQSKVWPLNNGRFYVPQLYDKGLKPAIYAFPWCSESQADFLLLVYDYWKLSGDSKFVSSIWGDVVYVTKSLELLDTNGNSLPDALQGTYDYTWLSQNAEEPLICALTSLAYSSVAKLAKVLDKNAYARRLEKLALKIKKTMNKSVQDGGLWKEDGDGGYYVYMRKFTKGEGPEQDSAILNVCGNGALRMKNLAQVNDKFIPYENLVPIWCGMTNARQDSAIFAKLDRGFDKYYDLKYGPEYCAPAIRNDRSVMDCSSVPWLGFMDVYLRGKTGHYENRSKIFDLLMKNAYDAGGVPFSEGAGVYGYLTGGGGRLWDNGVFFHTLICGIDGLEKSKDGIRIVAPEKIRGVPLTELDNFRWREATYNFKWTGKGTHIESVTLDGNRIAPVAHAYWLDTRVGVHRVDIHLSR